MFLPPVFLLEDTTVSFPEKGFIFLALPEEERKASPAGSHVSDSSSISLKALHLTMTSAVMRKRSWCGP